MQRFTTLMALFLFLVGCNSSLNTTVLEQPILPGNPDYVIQSDDSEYLGRYFYSTAFFNSNKPNLTVKHILDSIGSGKIALGIYNNSDSSFVISKVTDTLNDVNTINTIQLAFEIDSIKIFKSLEANCTLYSNDSLLLKSETTFTNKIATNAAKIKGRNAGYNLINRTSIKDLPIAQLNPSDSLISYFGQTYLNVDHQTNSVTYSGVSQLDSITLRLIAEPQPSKLLELLPLKSRQWQIFQVSQNFEISRKDSIKEPPAVLYDLASACLEIASLNKEGDRLMMFRLNDTSQLSMELDLSSPEETFKAYNIFAFDWNKDRLGPLGTMMPEFESKFLVVFENYALLGASIEPLKSLLSDILNNSTLINSERYKSLDNYLTSSFSYMSFADGSVLKTKYPDSDQEFNNSFFQLKRDHNTTHINGVLTNYIKSNDRLPVEEYAVAKTSNEILIGPQLVKNHINGAWDILVQDVENYVYLISNNGKVYWKKKINNPILGQVQQIDIYKNGRLQLAFCTKNKLYVLDRNGNEVNPFSINFRDPITQPLSVFDYDNNKNYRLLITQGKELLMLDSKGKRVRGFNYNTGKQITSQPKHFRMGRKDFILFKTENQLKILNRRGQPRVKVSDRFNFSKNDFYLYQGKFTTSNIRGELVQIDPKGRVTKSALNLPEDHEITATSKTLVSQTENTLNIKLKSVELDYGIYSPPQIFYLNDKIYVSTTDLQNKKVYLFDSQGKSIKGFPIFGVSSALLVNLDNSKGLEVVCQSDERSVSILKIQ